MSPQNPDEQKHLDQLLEKMYTARHRAMAMYRAAGPCDADDELQKLRDRKSLQAIAELFLHQSCGWSIEELGFLFDEEDIIVKARIATAISAFRVKVKPQLREGLPQPLLRS